MIFSQESFSRISAEVMRSCCSESVQGIPNWMAATGMAFIVILSHLVVNTRMGGWLMSPKRIDLFTRFPWFHKMVKKPYFPLVIQAFSVISFILVVIAGFFGNQKLNIAPVFIWTLWWILLIFLCTGFGTAFCAICPWEGFSSMMTSLSFRSRKKKVGTEKPWPKMLRNSYVALGMFVLLTWFELGLNLTKSPRMSAIMALAYLSMAVICAYVYERRAFCRYGCLVGRVSGIYALFSPVELRADSREVCRSCTTKDCYKGNETSVGCPMGIFPGALDENSACTSCTECVRACPEDNMRLRARTFAADLLMKARFRRDEAIFAVVMLALTSFHGLTMTPAWWRLCDLLRVETGLTYKPIFTILLGMMIVLPIMAFKASCWIGSCLSKDYGNSAKHFKSFAYSLIPVALFYHLAHNGMHFFMEVPNIIPLLSDPMGIGWNLFGTVDYVPAPLLSLDKIWVIQITLIIIGHVYGVIVCDRISASLFKDRKRRVWAMLPQILLMIALSAFSVWLIAQPMEMRGI